MSKSKLGPIPDDHFENEPGPPDADYPGKWPEDEIKAFKDETAAQKARIRQKQAKQD
jgi:hypothetical protein